MNVVSDSTNATYYSAVVKGADRLLALQNANGSWDWAVTGATAPTATTYLNVTGVTAEGLLSAYIITGKQVYLDAAKNAGDYIITEIDASTPKKINAYNVLFLEKLSSALSDPSYSAKAAEYFGMLYSNTPTSVCEAGCVDSAGIMIGQKAVRSWATNPNGIVLWDIVPYVEYAKLVGDDTHAQELADAIIADANLETYISSVTNYDLGLASALKAASLVGDATNVTALASKITSVDASYGTVSDGKIQTTSYMVRAFKLTSDSRATASAGYVVGGAMATGGWVDTDGEEYAEVDSEAITALVAMLPQMVQYYTIDDALNVANTGDTIVLGSDITVLEEVVIDKAVTIDGAGYTLSAHFNKTSDSNNSAIGIVHSDVTIQNLIVDGTGGPVWPIQLHGINVYLSTNVNLNTVTVSNFGGAGVVVNGSLVTVDDITTSGNAWGGINVDQGSGVTAVTTLTVNGVSTHTETNADIWRDDNLKTGVTVVDTNNQYTTSTYTHDISVTGTKYKLKVLESIAITTPATKLTYIVGESLDTTGLVVTGTYDNSSTGVVSPVDVTGFDSSVPVNDQVLTVTYGGETTTYTIDVVSPPQHRGSSSSSRKSLNRSETAAQNANENAAFNRVPVPGRVLGASTSANEEQLSALKKQVIVLIQQLILLLQAELDAKKLN